MFFGKLNLTDEWFNNALTRSLDELNPRYKSGFHVDEYDIQRHFDLLYRSDNIKKYILAIIDNAKKSLQQITEYRNIANSIKQIIDKLVVPESNNYELVLMSFDDYDIDISSLAIIVAMARSIEADTDKKGNIVSGSRKKKVQTYINSLGLKAAQKYMIMGYLGYSNKNGQQQVKSYIQRLSLTKSEKEKLYEYSGYAA